MTVLNLTISARLVACLFLLTVLHTHSSAQDRLDPVAMGKARASVASTRGIGAIGSNPGALDLPLTHLTTLDQEVVVSPYNLGGSIGSTYLSSSDFKTIFGSAAGWPNQDERKRLGELLQDERLFANGTVNLLTATYRTPSAGTFGLHYGHRAFARLNFPEDFTRVIAKGELLAEQYRFINRGVGGTWITELGLSYSKSIAFGDGQWFPTVSVGATAKLLGGVANFELTDNSYIAVDQTTIGGTRAYIIQGGYRVRSALPDGLDPADALGDFEAALFPPTSGSGLSADIGIAGVLYRTRASIPGTRPRNAVYFGAVIQDIGSVHWTDVAYDRSQTGIVDTIINGTLGNDQFKKYQGTLVRTDGYVTNLPMVVRAGFAVDVGAFATDLPNSLIIDIEGEVPVNQEVGNAPDPRLSVGADFGATKWLSLRTGISGGGINTFGIGLGVGLRPLSWLSIDIGTSELNGFFSGERLDLAFRLAAGF